MRSFVLSAVGLVSALAAGCSSLHMPWGHGDEPETAQSEAQAHGHGEGHAS